VSIRTKAHSKLWKKGSVGGIGVVIVKCVGLLGYIWADYIYVLDAVAYFVDSNGCRRGRLYLLFRFVQVCLNNVVIISAQYIAFLNTRWKL